MLFIVLNLFESPSFFNNLFVTSPLCLCLCGNEIVKFHFDLGTQSPFQKHLSPLHLINGWQWYLLMHLGVFLINYSYICNILQALERLSFGGRRIRETVIAQSRILLFWYSTTYLFLEKNKPKYQQLELPPPDQIQPEQQLETFTTYQVEKYSQVEPLPINQVESNQHLESPPIDQVRPFILEGLWILGYY